MCISVIWNFVLSVQTSLDCSASDEICNDLYSTVHFFAMHDMLHKNMKQI